MTPAVVIGPVITLSIWLGWVTAILVSIRRARSRGERRSICFVEIPTLALVIATLQLLFNLALPHFGDVTVFVTHAIFIGIAIASGGNNVRHALPRAWIHRG